MLGITLRRAAALTITLATFAACDDAPSAPRIETPAHASALAAAASAAASAAPVREGATVPFAFVVYAPCANNGQGEVLQAYGQLTYQGTWLTTEGERYHHALIESFTGSATGWESGETYDVQTRELAQGNTTYGNDGIPDSGEDMQRIQMRLTSRATGMVIDIVLTAHVVQIPSGEYVLDGWEGTARCR
jgi:hypothetical protein